MLEKIKKYIYFIEPIYAWADSRRILARLLGNLVKLLAVITTFYGLYRFFLNWFHLSQFGILGISGLLFFQLVFLGSLSLIVQIIWKRGEDIAEVDADNFVVLSFSSLVSRLIGEIVLVFFIGAGIATGVFLFLVGTVPVVQEMLIEFPLYTYTSTPIYILLLSLVIGFLNLLFFYLLAELLQLLVRVGKKRAV